LCVWDNDGKFRLFACMSSRLPLDFQQQPGAIAPAQEYDRATIYAPAQLQSYGCLIVVEPETGAILQASENVGDYLGKSAVVGESLAAFTPPQQWVTLQPMLRGEMPWTNPLQLTITTAKGKPTWAAIGHRLEVALVETSQTVPLIVLELEPLVADSVSIAASFALMRGAIAAVQQAADVETLLQRVVESMQRLTGCDRVMVYQFDAAGAGQVVAEVKPDDRESYGGRWFPAGDIPAIVRQFYLQGGMRYVPDLRAAAQNLEPAINPHTRMTLDLTPVMLRGVDDCCIEYHQQMAIGAFFIVGLVQEQRLWGMIACHHFQPKTLSYEVRATCNLLGQFVAAELANRSGQRAIQELREARSRQTQIMQMMSRSQDLKTALLEASPDFLALVNADGVAICLGNEVQLWGKTPEAEAVQELQQWVSTHVEDSLFYSDCLSKAAPNVKRFQSETWQAVASGVLVLQIVPAERYCVIWFRSEWVRTIAWLGNPENFYRPIADLAETAAAEMQRAPRPSLAEWQETMQSTAQPWQPIDIENALSLRHAIVDVVLRRTDELAKINLELQRRNQELESFAYAASHDLKEPLRGIYNSVTFLLEDYAEQLDEAGMGRIEGLLQLCRRMDSLIDVLLQFSRLGQAALNLQPTDLNQMIQQELKVVQESNPSIQAEIRIPRSLPPIACDPVLAREVWRNLLSNAFKYNNKPDAWVEIGYLNPAVVAITPPLDFTSHYVFFVRDNGIGIRERHLDSVFRLFKRLHPQHLYGGGTGAGLTIVKKIIERHGGAITVRSVWGEGTTFYFALEPPPD
jgi:two-component system, chemotaxis family, sensor kinase Cph1